MIRKSVVCFKSISNMLKPRLIASDLLKKRVEEKAKDKKLLILNNADFQVIGGEYQGFHPSLLVNSEGNSYLFNCGSGTQRYFYANKLKLYNIENVFITNRDWDRMAGLYGLSLTVQDVGSPNLRVHSTEGFEGFFEATDSFMTFTTGMVRSTRNHLDGQYTDSGIQVEPIVLDNETYASEDIRSEGTHSNKRLKVNPRLVAYLCSLPDLPGALDPRRCKELKIPVGRHLAVLKSGTDIELPDGRVIKSTDVCGPKNQGLSFLVIECPSENHIDNLRANKTLESIMERRAVNGEREVEMVVHFSPKDVIASENYRNWYQGFAETCKHLLMNNVQAKKILFSDCYQFQYLLGRLDSEIFPQLHLPPELQERVQTELKVPYDVRGESVQQPIMPKNKIAEISVNGGDKVIELEPLDKIVIRPRRFLEHSASDLPIDSLFEETNLNPDFEEELANLKKLQCNLPKPQEFEPEVVFLGTGSALPSKLRNTSFILLNFYHPNKSSVILDCGEDSLGQLIRFYGKDKSEEVLRQLKMIYISHHHADHHIGLIDLLRHRKMLTNEPLVLLAPPGVDTLLDYYNRTFDDLSGFYDLYSTKTLRLESSTDGDAARPMKHDLCDRLKGFLDNIDVVGVKHCVNSCAVSMRIRIGHPDMKTFTVSYSGDARPSSEFVRIGMNCDLLIHEATFDDKSQEDAIVKKHSTSTEAINISKEMQAKFTILTHFSARFPKIPYLTDKFDDSIGFAFDNLALRCPSHYKRIPIMKPVLRQVFKKSLAELEMRYCKLDLKQQTVDSLIKENMSKTT